MVRPLALLVAVLVLGAILPATATAAPSQSTQLSVSTGDGDPCIDNVAFFTTHSDANPPPFRVGFSADAGDEVFFVLETRDRVIGHTTLQTFDQSIHADGLRVPLTHPVAGVRNVTVTVHQDSNDNGVFDPGVDQPCTSDGDPVSSSLEFFVQGDGTGLQDTTVNASPAVAYQPATWTAETTVTQDMNVTHVDIDLRAAGPVANVAPGDVRMGYKPPVNATFVMPGRPATVSVHRNGVLRLTYPDGIDLKNGSRLTVHVDDVLVPPEQANVSLALSTPQAGYGATDSVDPAPVPHIEFYESFPEPGVHLRFGLPKDVTMFAVVLHDGEVVGTEYLDYGMAMTADGKPMAVEGVSGRAELTVRGYHDTNGNGVFDPDVDQPFVDRNGEPIGETATIELQGTSSSTQPPTTESPTDSTSTRTWEPEGTGTTPSRSTTPVPAPGFGLVAALIALLCIVGLHTRD